MLFHWEYVYLVTGDLDTLCVFITDVFNRRQILDTHGPLSQPFEVREFPIN